MSFHLASLPLKVYTPESWSKVVLQDFQLFLQDHASCERKAAALAMSFVVKYPDRKALIEPMVALAREELEHFQQVYRLLMREGLTLSLRDEKDGYVNFMIDKLRHGRDERFLDRLVMSGMVEARGYERFHILARAFEKPELRKFYEQLADKEAGHYRIFIKVAECYFPEEEVREAVDRIATWEAEAMLATPHSPRLH